MRVTTLRIGDDLWKLLESEAARSGVSVSQYIREAALARAAAAAGGRGDLPFEQITLGAREIASARVTPVQKRHAIELALGGLARALAQDEAQSAQALRGQSDQARRKSRSIQARGGQRSKN
jgi:hypothetical protein